MHRARARTYRRAGSRRLACRTSDQPVDPSVPLRSSRSVAHPSPGLRAARRRPSTIVAGGPAHPVRSHPHRRPVTTAASSRPMRANTTVASLTRPPSVTEVLHVIAAVSLQLHGRSRAPCRHATGSCRQRSLEAAPRRPARSPPRSDSRPRTPRRSTFRLRWSQRSTTRLPRRCGRIRTAASSSPLFIRDRPRSVTSST